MNATDNRRGATMTPPPRVPDTISSLLILVILRFYFDPFLIVQFFVFSFCFKVFLFTNHFIFKQLLVTIMVIFCLRNLKINLIKGTA